MENKLGKLFFILEYPNRILFLKIIKNCSQKLFFENCFHKCCQTSSLVLDSNGVRIDVHDAILFIYLFLFLFFKMVIATKFSPWPVNHEYWKYLNNYENRTAPCLCVCPIFFCDVLFNVDLFAYIK